MKNPFSFIKDLFNPWTQMEWEIERQIEKEKPEVKIDVFEMVNVSKKKDKPIYRDPLTFSRIMNLHPKIRMEAIDIYKEICEEINGYVVVRFTWTLRTFKDQEAIYNQGRTTSGKIVSWAKAGFSFHNYGLAIDICLLIDRDKNGTYEEASWNTLSDNDLDGIPDWEEVVSIFKKYGWEWGGDWNGKRKDKPHFQRTFGYSVAELLNKPKDPEGYPIIQTAL